jgi:hypothetical protein
MRVMGATEQNGDGRVHEIPYLYQTLYDAVQHRVIVSALGASAFCEAATCPRNARYLMSSSRSDAVKQGILRR